MAKIDALSKVDDETLELRMDQVERCVKALSSGISMSAFCKEEHVSPKTVETWARRLEVELPSHPKEMSESWVAVELPKPTAHSAPIEIELGKALVRVPSGSTPADVECVLRALVALQ